MLDDVVQEVLVTMMKAVAGDIFTSLLVCGIMETVKESSQGCSGGAVTKLFWCVQQIENCLISVSTVITWGKPDILNADLFRLLLKDNLGKFRKNPWDDAYKIILKKVTKKIQFTALPYKNTVLFMIQKFVKVISLQNFWYFTCLLGYFWSCHL